MTVFGDRAFNEEIKLARGLLWVLIQFDWCPHKRGNLDAQRDIRDEYAQRKGHVRTQREGGLVQVEQRSLRRNHICQHLDLGLTSLYNHENINFFCISHPVCSILLWYFQQIDRVHKTSSSSYSVI